MIRIASHKDIDKILNIYKGIILEENNNTRYTGWILNEYPNYDTVKNAIDKGEMFILTEANIVIGSVILNDKQPETYSEVKWLIEAKGSEVMVISTLAININFKKMGYGKKIIDFIKNYSKAMGCKTIRLETSQTNIPAASIYENNGFVYLESIDVTVQNITYNDLRCYEFLL
jgi:ribosomal protein S18 acetylase RimI-like enzyme